MKINSIIFIAFSFIISTLLFGCENTAQKTNQETVAHEGHHHDEENETIELNKGEKWKVDANMLAHIRTMETEVNTFAKSEQKDYKSLSEKLQSSLDLLTSNCTMEGKAHDELHKWLLPYIDMVGELSEAKNQSDAAQQFEHIQTSFRTFNQYFQ
jgi:hypothetical protein